TKSSSILNSLNSVTEKTLPATKLLYAADMYHEGIRSVVYEALSGDSQVSKERLSEIEKDLKTQSSSIVENVRKLKYFSFSKSLKEDIEALEKSTTQYVEASVRLVEFAANGEEVESIKAEFNALYTKLEKNFKNLDKEID